MPRKTSRTGAGVTAGGILVCALLLPASLTAGEPGALLGRFQVTYYYMAEEKQGGSWPLYGPSCATLLALTSREFHTTLSLEGSGRLRDGRVLNFEERCSCARPGHGGSRICYQVLDAGKYPWGRGGAASGRLQPLKPFRSVAVDPAVIPLGTVLFIPAWAGRRAPDGRLLDGCFRAEDTGRLIKRFRLDLFVGTHRWADVFQRKNGFGHVEVYRGGGRCRGVFPG